MTEADWQRCLKRFNHSCAVCGTQDRTLVQDHWVPIVLGGEYTPDNIVPLCHGAEGCTNNKGDKDPIEWLHMTYRAQEVDEILGRIQKYFESL